MPYEVVIIPVIVVLILSFIQSAIFKNKEKVDKGFVFFYSKLTYRRKMIRDLWSLPIIVISLFVIYRFSGWGFHVNLFVTIILLALYVIQLLYNFMKWKKFER